MENVTLVPGGPPQNMPVNAAAITTTAPATGNAVYKPSSYCSFQLIAAAAATVIIEATNEDASGQGTNNNWVLLGTITLAGAGSDGFVTLSDWRWVRARVTVASANTYVLMGV